VLLHLSRDPLTEEVHVLYSVKNLKGAAVMATDAELGSFDDAYFDDARWTLRYLVVNTGTWLFGRRVLISPQSLGEVDWNRRRVQVKLTQQQVKDSPAIDTDQPVSRQEETRLHGYYGLPEYWSRPMLWGAAAYPVPPMPPVAPQTPATAGPLPGPRDAAAARAAEVDAHLRSATEVIGYAVEASDGGIGSIEDFMLDDRSWSLRYAAIDTGNWLPGRHVLVAPQWIAHVSWAERRVYVDATRAQIEASPEYDPGVPLSDDYEQRLHAHYGRAFLPFR
jgi:uncharacterized protein YrrD